MQTVVLIKRILLCCRFLAMLATIHRFPYCIENAFVIG